MVEGLGVKRTRKVIFRSKPAALEALISIRLSPGLRGSGSDRDFRRLIALRPHVGGRIVDLKAMPLVSIVKPRMVMGESWTSTIGPGPAPEGRPPNSRGSGWGRLGLRHTDCRICHRGDRDPAAEQVACICAAKSHRNLTRRRESMTYPVCPRLAISQNSGEFMDAFPAVFGGIVDCVFL